MDWLMSTWSSVSYQLVSREWKEVLSVAAFCLHSLNSSSSLMAATPCASQDRSSSGCPETISGSATAGSSQRSLLRLEKKKSGSPVLRKLRQLAPVFARCTSCLKSLAASSTSAASAAASASAKASSSAEAASSSELAPSLSIRNVIPATATSACLPLLRLRRFGRPRPRGASRGTPRAVKKAWAAMTNPSDATGLPTVRYSPLLECCSPSSCRATC
mmetsp:Transcript_1759/g.3350  ORF Transcript_1759/g.3350 Transcript_1759/m.3350 type:complete len:217 (+) Transcript_1759:700-1350(+)